MKKTLLMLAAALVALSATAQTAELKELPRITAGLPGKFAAATPFPETAIVTNSPAKAAAQTESMDYTPASSPYTYTSLKEQKAGMKIATAFQMPPAAMKKFAGNQISNVFFYTGINSAKSTQQIQVNTIKKATIFLTHSLQDFKPFYTQQVDLPEDALTLVSYKLDTPYDIKAGETVYVGVYYSLSSADDETLIIDYTYHGTETWGGWIGVQAYPTTQEPNPEWQFDNLSSQIGYFCNGVTITGNKLPVNEVSVPQSAVQPTVYQNEPFEFQFIFLNEASNPIESIDVDVKVGDSEPRSEHFEADKPISYNSMAIAGVSNLSYPDAALDEIPVSVTVTKVNGNKNTSAAATSTAYIQVLPTGKGYKRNVVVEEFTGNWCGYCPQGIVTMDKLREVYTDGSVIPVAIHMQNNDPMISPTYNQVGSSYATGFPSAIMNRQMYIDNIYPTENCMSEIEAYMAYPSPAKVTATAHLNEKRNSIIFDAVSSFSFDNDKAAEYYTLAFGVTEDNVGPYEQHNHFSGEQSGTLPGWDGSVPEYVSLKYNDVARQYNSIRGITGSVPEKVEAGKEYSFSYEMKFLAASKIDNVDNLNGVVYLINRKNNTVENAFMVDAKTIAGVEGVEVSDDTTAPVEYFNLQGIKVAEPRHGLYIRRQGAEARTVLMR